VGPLQPGLQAHVNLFVPRSTHVALLKQAERNVGPALEPLAPLTWTLQSSTSVLQSLPVQPAAHAQLNLLSPLSEHTSGAAHGEAPLGSLQSSASASHMAPAQPEAHAQLKALVPASLQVAPFLQGLARQSSTSTEQAVKAVLLVVPAGHGVQRLRLAAETNDACEAHRSVSWQCEPAHGSAQAQANLLVPASLQLPPLRHGAAAQSSTSTHLAKPSAREELKPAGQGKQLVRFPEKMLPSVHDNAPPPQKQHAAVGEAPVLASLARLTSRYEGHLPPTLPAAHQPSEANLAHEASVLDRNPATSTHVGEEVALLRGAGAALALRFAPRTTSTGVGVGAGAAGGGVGVAAGAGGGGGATQLLKILLLESMHTALFWHGLEAHSSKSPAQRPPAPP